MKPGTTQPTLSRRAFGIAVSGGVVAILTSKAGAQTPVATPEVVELLGRQREFESADRLTHLTAFEIHASEALEPSTLLPVVAEAIAVELGLDVLGIGSLAADDPRTALFDESVLLDVRVAVFPDYIGEVMVGTSEDTIYAFEFDRVGDVPAAELDRLFDFMTVAVESGLGNVPLPTGWTETTPAGEEAVLLTVDVNDTAATPEAGG